MADHSAAVEPARQPSLWGSHARQWQAVGVPQRPGPEDLALLTAASGLPERASGTSQEFNVALLGVTPELVNLAWPADTRLQAFDRSDEVIATLWHPHPSISCTVTQARWDALPVPEACFDLILGDGCTTQFPDLSDYEAFLREAHRILRPGGSLVMRCFLREHGDDSPERIARRAWNGEIRQFGSLKWLLAMALTEPNSFTVPVQRIWSCFNELFPERQELSRCTGWAADLIDTIDAYRDKAEVYTFPTLEQLRQLSRPWFHPISATHGSYELAECCPVLRFTPSAG